MVRVATKPTAISKVQPAPTGGWNARDNIAAMDIRDAVVMTNWWPATTNVVMRYGYTQHATGIPGQTEALLVYNGPTDSEMFAADDQGDIYDVSAAGAVGAAVVTGLTNGRFQYINVTTTGGSFLMAVNGSDKLQGYNGTAWYEDGDGTHDITGVNTATCGNIAMWKNRVWLAQNGTLDAWYLPTSAIAGAATKLPLGGIAQLGGYIVAIGTWTIDAGYGVDDLLAFITSQGEVLVYRGTDPSSASTFALVGVWQVGEPVGKRCLMKYGGDLLYICEDGVLPLSGALQSSRVNPKVSLTDKITYAMSQAISLYGDNFGWELMYFPKENQLYLNVPVQEGNNQQQYVMNTISKNWCAFQGWKANCWAIFNEMPYFGGNGFVGAAWNGLTDNNTDIQAFCIQAFSHYQTPNLQKRFTTMRPLFYTDGAPSVLAEINVDFDLSDTTAPLSFSGTTYATWDNGLWDTALWGTDLAVQQDWQGATGIGFYGAPVMKVVAQGINVQWNQTTVVFEPAGGISL